MPYTNHCKTHVHKLHNKRKMIILGNKGDYWSSLNFYQLKVWIIFIFNPSDGMYHHQSKGYDETLTDVLKI